MAHYVAELIDAAEADADSAGGPIARSRAAEEILQLWSHRRTMPRPYPLESFDRIFAALDRLENPQASNRLGRYFGDDAPTDPQLAVVPILQMAARVDDEVSDVVACLIAEAVTYAEDADAPWVPIALKIGEDESARALRRLKSLARRRSLSARFPEAEDEADASPKGDQAIVDGLPAGEEIGDETEETGQDRCAGQPEGGPSEEDTDAARREALMEAIDCATATLIRLRALVVESLDSSDA